MIKKTTTTFADLLEEAIKDVKFPEYGDIIEGTVLKSNKSGIWVDLGIYGTGVIMGPEIANGTVKDEVNPGDVISASVIDEEFDNGQILLSLGTATRGRSWERLQNLMEKREAVIVRPLEANKGGLLIEIDGIKGFLPVSQLSAKNYPRAADKDQILNRLRSLVGKAMEVGVLDANKDEAKLIFSEKIVKKGELQEVLKNYAVGNKVQCKVTGVVDFGVFVTAGEVEGLIHISEISWEKVENPSKYVNVGDEIEVIIIGIDDERLSLSIKRLAKDPWVKELGNLKVGSKIDGKVTRITPYGAFAKIKDKIEALVHVSELSDEHVKSPEDVVKVGETYKFTVVTINKDAHRLALSLKEGKEEKALKTAKKETEKE